MGKQNKGTTASRVAATAKAGKRKRYLQSGDPARTHDGPLAFTRSKRVKESTVLWREKHKKALDGTEDHKVPQDTHNRDHQPESDPDKKKIPVTWI